MSDFDDRARQARIEEDQARVEQRDLEERHAPHSESRLRSPEASPTKKDLDVAIEVLKGQGMAGIDAAVFHGRSVGFEKLVEAVESVARVVVLLRGLRDEADDG